MPRWEFAMISNPSSGTDGVRFSMEQRPTLVQEFAAALGRGLKAENSKRDFLHLNLSHTNVVRVAGLLGQEGWELVSHAALTGGHEYLTFKRQLPDE